VRENALPVVEEPEGGEEEDGLASEFRAATPTEAHEKRKASSRSGRLENSVKK
jgi:hypothetical protein